MSNWLGWMRAEIHVVQLGVVGRDLSRNFALDLVAVLLKKLSQLGHYVLSNEMQHVRVLAEVLTILV